MTRLKISIIIIAALIGTSIYQGVMVGRECSSLMEQTAQAEEFFRSGNAEKSMDITAELQEKWEKFRSNASVFVRNNKLTELDRLVARVHHLAENESEELSSELTELYHLLELLKNSEIPKWTSVF